MIGLGLYKCGIQIWLSKRPGIEPSPLPKDSERAMNEEASICENELSVGTLTNSRTQVRNQRNDFLF